MATRMTACPQLVYTSASRTLEGPGFGVFAMSRDWPAALGTSRSSLGALIRPPGDGEAFGLLSASGGRLAYSKAPAVSDDFGRAGNYVVQLLWDGGSSLAPRDVLALHRSGGFLSSVAGAEPSRDAPPVAVPRARRLAPVLALHEVEALVPAVGAVLAALAAGVGQVGLPAASVVFDVLPRALADSVSLHVGTAETMGDAAAVQVLVGAYRQPPVDAANAARARALLEAAAKGDLCPDDVARVDELDAWLFADEWRELDPATLTDAQLVAVLASPAAGAWLQSPRAASVVTVAAAESPAVEAALRTAVARDPAARAGVRAAETGAVLRAVFEGSPGRTTDFAGLTQGDLCAGFVRELARGRRVPRISAEAGLLVEQALGLGHDVPLVGLTDDAEGLAGLVARRPVVREALLREWSLTTWSPAHEELLVQLLRYDAEWFPALAPLTPEKPTRAALRAAAREMSARQVEKLAVTVASSEAAGHGLALRCVLFPSGLPPEEISAIVARNFALLARDDGWPRGIAARTAGRLGDDPPPATRRRRR
ncbi:hypothetical protein ACI797_19965 [Geodermatophilus sp. SYSU D00691]